MGGLGINKDLEPLVRAVRRQGGTVVLKKSGHVLWKLGQWTMHSGLTMSERTSRNVQRRVMRQLSQDKQESLGQIVLR